jgi:hypothetical protein
MSLQQSVRNVFVQLTASLKLLDDKQYSHQGIILSGASIGQHVRHIIEMFICLEEGYVNGILNYENRRRDRKLETQKDCAIALLKEIYEGLQKENKPLIMEAVFDEGDQVPVRFDTNYYREVAYNLEHTIHHMALIKVGIREVSDMEIPGNFGVASSTIKFRAACAQ